MLGIDIQYICSILIVCRIKEIEKQGSKNYALYGQESTGTTYQLARMNMFLHGRDSARLEWGGYFK